MALKQQFACCTMIIVLLLPFTTSAQTYEETVNFIFNGNKEWSRAQYGRYEMLYNSITDYDKEHCTATILIDIKCDNCNLVSLSTLFYRKGTIYLAGLTRWSWEVYRESPFVEYGLLTLESEGDGCVG